MNSLKFKIPKFNKQHNELLVDVYKNGTFDVRQSIAPYSEFFLLNNCNKGDLYSIHVIPSNYGSVYDSILMSEEKFIVDPLIKNPQFDSFFLNGNLNKFYFDKDSNKYIGRVKSSNQLDSIKYKTLYNNELITVDSHTLNSFDVSVYTLNGDIVDNFNLIDSHNFIFKKIKDVRDYRIDCSISSIYSGHAKSSIFLSAQVPTVNRISHRLDFSEDKELIHVFFDLFYKYNPKEIKCTVFSDEDRTQVVSEKIHTSTHLIQESIPYNSHRFFEFSIYDSFGLCSTHKYYKNFYFSK